mmetsp:Transcript_91741/g.268525  ORF Transcript_91741/g.268525 Transcript_91741/m.268525 type:complete len:230 (-) Transcript_91741:158-847(-)
MLRPAAAAVARRSAAVAVVARQARGGGVAAPRGEGLAWSKRLAGPRGCQPQWSLLNQHRASSSDLQFTETHEWVRTEGDSSVLGISDHAQGLLGEAFWCELPPAGSSFKRQELLATLEGMRHPEESPEDAAELDVGERPAEGAYSERGWLVQEVTVGRLGNMRSITREVYAPADCVVVESNGLLERDRSLINTSAEGKGWLVRLRFSEGAPDLMEASAYHKLVESNSSR